MPCKAPLHLVRPLRLGVRGLSMELRGRDVSVVSRQIQQLAQKAPVLQKKGMRWILTPLGRELADWARQAVIAQQLVLQRRTTLRIATTREFASRVLIPGLHELMSDAPGEVMPCIVASDDGVEGVLLSGRADFAFDCGRPESASIRFRRVCIEPLAVVASPGFLRRHRVRERSALVQLPYVRFSRMNPSHVLRLTETLDLVSVVVDDLAAARAACKAGLGWSVLPAYTVADEVKAGTLKNLDWPNLEPDHFGVYWLRSNTHVEAWVQRAVGWLKGRTL